MTLLGRIISNKTQAKSLVALVSSRFDGTLESSVAITNIESILVSNGFLTWEEAEQAEEI